ncbi:hypothetical protein BD408DRAFT_487156 [Parasitella parasitica]|nr:hypothetical protein BD408DRAFT_487156 [Parasitella parasitica]
MNVFETCFAKKRSDIYLPEDDGEDDDDNVNRMCCCFDFRGNQRQGLIQLPTNNNNSQRTIDDYLDPRSPVSIEVLLQEQEEELDHYYGQTDDEDGYHGPQKKFSPFDLNFENTNASFFEEEDAQFISEHRISAILDDCRKSTDLQIPEDILNQEMLEEVVSAPTKRSSTANVSNRRFAFKMVQPEEETESNTEIPLSASPQELSSINNTCKPYTSSVISLSASSSLSTTSASLPSTTHKLAETVIERGVVEKGESVSPANAVALDLSGPSSGNYSIPAGSQNTQRQKHGEFPATTLTRVPYQPLPPPLHTTDKLQTSTSSSTYTQRQSSGRRPSLVTTAQTILGDKLDDFTEKLAFIKKNIIMSLDSDDEDHYYNADSKKAGSAGKSDRNSSISNGSSASLPSPLPLRTSSMTNNSADRKLFNAQHDSDEEEEEIFDFSKVVAIRKNMRTFGEGMMDNGLRMFNSLSTRIKNAQQQQQQHQHQNVELNTNDETLHVRF